MPSSKLAVARIKARNVVGVKVPPRFAPEQSRRDWLISDPLRRCRGGVGGADISRCEAAGRRKAGPDCRDRS